MPSQGSKSVKKEIEDVDEHEKKPTPRATASSKLPKVKKEQARDSDSPQKKTADGGSKSAKVNKLENFDFDSDDDKPISKKSVSKDTKLMDKKKKKMMKKEEIKKKTNGEAEESNAKKREKKVYDLPGQKRDPPEERDPMRIFYGSLYQQVPDSEMAAIWMMESGLLAEDEARKVLERKQKKNQVQKLGSPMKVVSTEKRSAQSASKSVTIKKMTKATNPNVLNKKTATPVATGVKSKKRKKSESESEEDLDDEFVISKVVKKQRA